MHRDGDGRLEQIADSAGARIVDGVSTTSAGNHQDVYFAQFGYLFGVEASIQVGQVSENHTLDFDAKEHNPPLNLSAVLIMIGQHSSNVERANVLRRGPSQHLAASQHGSGVVVIVMIVADQADNRRFLWDFIADLVVVGIDQATLTVTDNPKTGVAKKLQLHLDSCHVLSNQILKLSFELFWA